MKRLKRRAGMVMATIAQGCARYRVPLLVAKESPDRECEAATDIGGDLAQFPTEQVGKRAAALTRRVIGRLGQDRVGG